MKLFLYIGGVLFWGIVVGVVLSIAYIFISEEIFDYRWEKYKKKCPCGHRLTMKGRACDEKCLEKAVRKSLKK